MRRAFFICGIIVMITAVAAGAYLGYQNAHPAATTAPAKPVTVPKR